MSMVLIWWWQCWLCTWILHTSTQWYTTPSDVEGVGCGAIIETTAVINTEKALSENNTYYYSFQCYWNWDNFPTPNFIEIGAGVGLVKTKTKLCSCWTNFFRCQQCRVMGMIPLKFHVIKITTRIIKIIFTNWWELELYQTLMLIYN